MNTNIINHSNKNSSETVQNFEKYELKWSTLTMFILIPTSDSQQNIKSLAMTTTMEASVLSNLNCKAAAKKKKECLSFPTGLNTRNSHHSCVPGGGRPEVT